MRSGSVLGTMASPVSRRLRVMTCWWSAINPARCSLGLFATYKPCRNPVAQVNDFDDVYQNAIERLRLDDAATSPKCGARARLKHPLKMNSARARVKITTNPSFASRPAAAFAPPPGHQPLTSLITALSWRQFLRFFRIGDDKNRAE